MGTGIDELDHLVDGGKAAAGDIRQKWKMKLAGVVVTGVGALTIVMGAAHPNIKGVGIGIVVVGVLMILGTGGIKFVLKELYSAGKNTPRTKV